MNTRFSVIILCYRHFQYLLPAIDSVLEQDYPDIELIISDDCSDAFPADEIRTYIESNKCKNITNVIIRQQKENGGTVKHLNGAIPECSGGYIITLAGDDTLHHSSVLSTYVREFEKAPENCYIEMAHTAMYDNNLEQLQDYYPKLPVQNAIQKTAIDSSDLLELLITHGACLPTNSTCFKKRFFDKFGPFDERYILIEDYPMHIRLAKEGWKIHYANFIAIKHRDGGISHGHIDASSRSAKLYYTDTINMLKDLTMPAVAKLPKAERSAQKRRIKGQILWFELVLAKADKNLPKIITLMLKNPAVFFFAFLQREGNVACKWHAKMLCAIFFTWFSIPTVSNMLEELFQSQQGYFVLPLYYVSFFMALCWLLLFVLSVAYKMVFKIMRLSSQIIGE